MKGNHFLQDANRHELFPLCLRGFTQIYLCLSVFLFVFICVFIPIGARAAVLFLDSSSVEYRPGDTFNVAVRIDNEDECVNAVEVNLKFPREILEAFDFQDGESILVFWVKRPEINQEEGIISFIGGVPGGYCGKLHPNSGFTDILGKIIFKARDSAFLQDTAEVGFMGSKVLVNDGIGTEAKLIAKSAEFKIKYSPEIANRYKFEHK